MACAWFGMGHGTAHAVRGGMVRPGAEPLVSSRRTRSPAEPTFSSPVPSPRHSPASLIFCPPSPPPAAMLHPRRPRWPSLPLRLAWLLFAFAFFFCAGASALPSAELPVLTVGEERKRESLAFFDGSSCEYEVQGLQERKWYEIKISYPSTIPARIDISFRQHNSDYKWRAGRRLLNTEKTIFYITEYFSQEAETARQRGRATVEVHPDGVISKHLASDHPFIIYNILCEEVVLGIPKQAVWVGLFAALVICSAFYISARLPATLNSGVVKGRKGAE